HVFARLQRIPDVLAVAEQIERDGSPDELNRLLAHLASISPGKSKALDRLIDLVGTLPHPAAASTAEGLRRRVHYRRVPRADLTLRIFDRVEDWAFQLEDAFGDITEIPPARAGLFVKMAEDLCNLHSAGDWREAAEGLTAANFHDLAAVFENRARELTSP
ncbi:MAG: hypothetical protein H6734_26290, partial [Alphaproteobacteria bacterium]|nr:hypothetical protein [Alphaproteobacteria bacterium]